MSVTTQFAENHRRPHGVADGGRCIPKAQGARSGFRRVVIGVVASFVLRVPAVAHPHVWITYSAVAQMHGSTLVAVQEHWTFSKGFPLPIVGDISAMPKSGPVGARYTEMFKQQAFSALKDANYFTQVYADGRQLAVGEARGFRVSMDKGSVTYDFVVPLMATVDVTRAKVQLGVWDESFFVDIEGARPQAVTFDPHTSTACTATNFDDRNHPIFNGLVIPHASMLRC